MRGISLDHGEPDLRFGVSYDHGGGGYAGLSGIVGETSRDGVKPLGYLAYAGFAHQTSGGLVLDVGATNSDITIYQPARSGPPGSYAFRVYTYEYHAFYTEIFAGLSRGSIGARLYLSPNYLDQGNGGAYLDLSKSFELTARLRVFVHAGALTPLGESDRPGADRERLDLGAGTSWAFRHAELRLVWTGTWPSVEYPAGYRQKEDRVVLSATHFF